jgi:hypothetical protein
MQDAYNASVSDDHPTDAGELALEVFATGFVPGTDLPTTIDGAIM